MSEFEIKDDNVGYNEVLVDEPDMGVLEREAAKINALSDVNRGLDPFERLGKEDAVTQFSNDLRTRRIEDISRSREQSQGDAYLETASDASVGLYKSDMDGSNGLIGPYRQKALEIVSGGLVDSDADELAFAMMYNMELAEELNPEGILDIAGDVAGTMVPLRETYNLAELGNHLGFIGGANEYASAIANPGGLMEKMRAMALNLSVEDRTKMFEDTVKHLDTLDNKAIKGSIIRGIFQGSYNPDVMNLFNTLDLADVATGIGGIAKVATGLAKAGKMVNLVRKHPTPESYDLMVMAHGTEVGHKAGITSADVADLHNPLLHHDLGVDTTGAPEDVASDIVSMLEAQNARVRGLQNARIREGVLTREREEEIMAAAEDSLRYQSGSFNMVVEKTDTGFRINYDRAKYDPDTDSYEVVEEGVERDFTIDDQGHFTTDLDNEFFDQWHRMDPNSRFRGMLHEELVNSAQGIAREQGKIINTFEKMLKDAYGALNKKEAAQLDRILLQGSREQKEYSFSDLKALGATDKVAKAYFGQRNVSSHLYNFENQKLIDQMVALGVRLVDTDDGNVAARSWDDAATARAAYLNDDPDSFSILVLDDGLPGMAKGDRMQFDSAGQLSQEAVDEAYRRGFVLARNYHKKGNFRHGDSRTEWAFVKADKVRSPKGQRVLNKVDGYVPKARKNSFFFIKKNRDTGVSDARVRPDGGRRQEEVTLGWSDSYESAVRFASRMGEDARVVFDRELSPENLQDDMLLVRGGLFGGKRKEEELQYVGDNATFEYESVMDMMERYINHLGRQVPSHLWRLGTEQRAITRAREFMPTARINNINDIIPQAEKILTKGSKQFKLLKETVDQIKLITGVPTDEEKAMARRFENIGKSFEGIPTLKPLSKLFYKAAQRNLSIGDKIRGVTFLHMLGMYNPAQFLVQASGSLVAFAVNPVAFSKALPKTIGWQMLDGFARDPQAQARAADWLRSQGLGDYADSYLVWSKSGFRESVISANSDIATLFGSKPYNAGLLQRALANNRVFYESGELFMSRASVATAVEWYKGTNKLNKIDINDEEALRKIYNRAEQYRLNMGKANRSKLNEGWKAVPFQFQQVISKYYEKIFTDELTKAERVRLFAIPAAMAGAASVPGSNFIVQSVADMAGVDLSQMSPEQVTLFEAGAMGWMLNEALDVNVDFSSRMSLGTDLWNNMLEFAAGGGGNVLATALGPSGSIVTRYTQAGQYLWTSLDTVAEMEQLTSNEVVLLGKVVADALGSIPSGTRNLKTYMPHVLGNTDAFIKDGRFLWEWEDMNTQTAVMASLGFQPTEMNDLYNLVHEMRGTSAPQGLRFTKDHVDVVSHIISTGMMGTDKEEELSLYRKVVQAHIKALDPIDRADFVRRVWDNLNTRKYDQEDLFQTFRMHNLTHMEDGLNFINRTVSAKQQAWDARSQNKGE